jgi:cytochrome c
MNPPRVPASRSDGFAPGPRGALRWLPSLPLVLLAFWISPAQASDKALIERGRMIAKMNCGRCHAIGRTGESANPKSPPFRYIAKKYPLRNLEEALAEGILVGHEGPEMPQFALSTAQIEALLAYLGSIQTK